MKISRCLLPLLAVVAVAFSGCGKSEAEKAAEEKAAVEQFKADLASAAAVEPPKGILDKALAKMKQASQLPAKLKAIKTEKLPPDLKAAFGDLVAKFGKIEPVLAQFGATAEERAHNLVANPTAGPKLWQDIQPLLPEIEAAAAKLNEVGKKYGVQKLADLMP